MTEVSESGVSSSIDGAILACRGLSVRFGSIEAVKTVDLEIQRGTIHALVGENGAGKSTCLGVLAGRVKPTSGQVLFAGRALTNVDPRQAKKLGIASIYQELTIAPNLRADANVFLGTPLSRIGMLSRRRMREEYETLCRRLDVTPDHGATASELSVASQQMLEIMRAIRSDADVILFDEPTASLAQHERQSLVALMKRLRQDGVTMVFVSHNLDEVLELADEITVFRDGAVSGRFQRGQCGKAEIVAAMLGGETALFEARRHRRPVAASAPLLEVSGLTCPAVFEDVSLSLAEGEILGIAGLVGSGRSTLLRSIAGVERRSRGRMRIDGKGVPWPSSPRRARSLGISSLPEDRKRQGLNLTATAAENVVLSNLGAAARWGWLSPERVAATASEFGNKVGFDKRRMRSPARILSGGNQQKLLLARCMFDRPRVLLVDEPTRGIDIGAKAEILRGLEALAKQGVGVIAVSSELEELIAVCHRILILRAGHVVASVDNTEGSTTVESLLTLAFGGDTATGRRNE